MSIAPEKIKAAREAVHLTISEAARRAGMGKSGWWEIEAGRADPRASTIASMAQVLSVSPGWLFSGTGKPELSEVERRVIAAMRG